MQRALRYPSAVPLLSSDPHAWLRPYYARLAEDPAFARIDRTLQFLALVESVGIDHPTKAAHMREWPEPYQRATITWLADVIQQHPPEREVELWRVRKDGRELRAIAVYLPNGIDLRLMDGEDFRRTELLRDAPALQARAQEWRGKLAGAGWG